MSRLVLPKAPPQLAWDIAARIAQLDSVRDAPERNESQILAVARRRTKLGWLSMLLGAAVCLACTLYGLYVGAWRFNVPNSMLADFAHLDDLRRLGPIAYALLLGALLYLQGIFIHSNLASDNARSSAR